MTINEYEFKKITMLTVFVSFGTDFRTAKSQPMRRC